MSCQAELSTFSVAIIYSSGVIILAGAGGGGGGGGGAGAGAGAQGTGVTFAPIRGSHSPLTQKGSHSPLINNNLNMLLNPLGFYLGTRGLLGGLGFRGGHGGIC